MTESRGISLSPVSRSPKGREFKGLRFEDTITASAPIPFSPSKADSPDTSRSLSPSPRQPSLNGTRRSKRSFESRSSIFKRRSYLSDDARRDSGMAPSFSTVDEPTVASRHHSPAAAKKSMQDVPSIVVHDSVPPTTKGPSESEKPWAPPSRPSHPTEAVEEATHEPQLDASNLPGDQWYQGLTTEIPTGDFDDPFASNEISFSKRGSVLWGGKRSSMVGSSNPSLANSPRMSTERQRPTVVPHRAISAEEKRLSQKLRSMYEHGDEDAPSLHDIQPSPIAEEDHFDITPGGDTLTDLPQFGLQPRSAEHGSYSKSSSAMSSRRVSWIRKEPQEAAGGIEDWNDVSGNDVDRYGFIKPQNAKSGRSSMISSPVPGTPDHERSQRDVNGLEPVEEDARARSRPPRGAETPRTNRLSILNRSRPPSRSKNSSRAPSIMSTRSRRSNSSFNIFRPGTANKGRRWADAAPEMLTQQPGLPESALNENIRRFDPASTQHERQREAKWQAMAKPMSATPGSLAKSRTTEIPTVGGGTVYTFNVHDPKLINRVWKGIPDRWRAPAWRSFLEQSARRQLGPNFIPDETLLDHFHEYQEIDCPDDSQIDMDVPRTIGGHIMFRRRYRGGQRLLFRVLRALAIHFPVTGYVQGMATLAATLLCYYDEEAAFIMGVRLWQCRGLEELYSPGFEGLMEVLQTFEKDWLVMHPAAKQLERLGVVPTSYGTKWYLTLFNNTIPFQAQLRVWDVLMLLGDGTWNSPGTKGPRQQQSKSKKKTTANFDLLHAVAAALVDSMQDALLDADFENAMKCLTGHVAVGREDVLMDIVRKEWKEKAKRRR
ncbi:MAG: hypothetical protein M1828_003480 [Chrysothrix sp. TS-e1954]|nr:MAG: hypothetical protein M1828_003480 [Chrysothrix sp. TS-e1954]